MKDMFFIGILIGLLLVAALWYGICVPVGNKVGDWMIKNFKHPHDD